MRVGQYFELMENGQSSNYTIYHWTRGIYTSSGSDTSKGTYMIVFEPKEITFYSYFHAGFENSKHENFEFDTDKNGYKTNKHKILSIPYNIRKNSIERITGELNALLSSQEKISKEMSRHTDLIKSVVSAQPLSDSVNIRFFGHADATTNQKPIKTKEPKEEGGNDMISTGLVFQTFIHDFLWDLKVNNCFNYSKNESQVIQVVDKIPLFKGLYLKMHFRELSNFLVGNWNSHTEDWMQNSLNEISKSWMDFLTSPKHETLFTTPESEKNFDSVDAEIDFVLKRSKRLKGSTIRSDRGEKIANFMLSRYDYFKIIKHFASTFLYRMLLFFIGLISTIFLVELFCFYFLPNSKNITYGGELPNLAFSFAIVAFISNFIVRGRLRKWSYFSFLIPNMLVPKLVVSIATIWLFFLGTDEVFDLFESNSASFPIELVSAIVLLLVPLLYKELKTIAPSSSLRRIFGRIVSLFIIGGIISYSLGAVAWSFSFNKRIESGDDKKDFVFAEWRRLSEPSYRKNADCFYPNTELRPLDSLENLIKQSETYLAELKVMSDWFGNLANAYSLKEDFNISDSNFYEFEIRVFAVNATDLFLKEEVSHFNCDHEESGRQELKSLVHDYIQELKEVDDFDSFEVDYLKDLEKKHKIQSKIWLQILAENENKEKNKVLITTGFNHLKKNLDLMPSFTKHHVDFYFFHIDISLPHGILFRQSLIALFLGLFIQILLQKDPKMKS